MKTLFIPSQRKLKANKSKILEISKQLPKKISIAYSIQFKDLAQEIKQILSGKSGTESEINSALTNPFGPLQPSSGSERM